MTLNATDISLIFLGILIVLVLLEVRKLSRRPEQVSRLEETFERISQQMERMGVAPPDMELPGGAQIVEARQNFETISEQLERLGRSTDEIEIEMLGEEGLRRFLKGLGQLQAELRTARELFEKAAQQMEGASGDMAGAAAALSAVEKHLDGVLAPATRSQADQDPRPG